MRYVMIAIGGSLGAIARYEVANLVQAHVPAGFPWGTFVVNMSACVVMGMAATLLTDRLVPNPQWRYLIAIGFIGAYSTFSTFILETFRSNTEGAWMIGGLYVVSSVVMGYLALWAGVALAQFV